LPAFQSKSLYPRTPRGKMASTQVWRLPESQNGWWVISNDASRVKSLFLIFSFTLHTPALAQLRAFVRCCPVVSSVFTLIAAQPVSVHRSGVAHQTSLQS